ncbi:MAG: noncanonical pyrimidine nucleotidase, YjjG family [Flavobacteriaceae bacterium]|nr:noncanonical pyrimidine nucleotidase, YjjG family [Flavobacteriaceae bacterium]|tara:strand:- start:50 stop:760 length:711 start_codon:yes stop_codon:yes gene_type:complete
MENITKKKTIFFDLDHTLWDFEKNSKLTFFQLFNYYDLPFEYSYFLKYYIPINHKYWDLFSRNKISKSELRTVRFRETFEVLNFKYDTQFLDKISNDYIEILPTKTNLFKGVKKMLEKLFLKYNLHIITNGFEDVQLKKIKLSGISKFFGKVITSEKAGQKKPNPKIFKYALSLIDEIPENCIMIGDNFFADISGSINIGMNAIHFNSNNEDYHDICPIIYSYNDNIYKLIKNLNK